MKGIKGPTSTATHAAGSAAGFILVVACGAPSRRPPGLGFGSAVTGEETGPQNDRRELVSILLEIGPGTIDRYKSRLRRRRLQSRQLERQAAALIAGEFAGRLARLRTNAAIDDLGGVGMGVPRAPQPFVEFLGGFARRLAGLRSARR